MGGLTKEQLLARLQELQIVYSKYEHEVVLTVEAQAKHVGHLGGALSKNLFLKDKKHRFYVVSAMANTKVDLSVLSARLGLGKGGLRMAPEEALDTILQVPRGCVTPFAVVNESARHVSLLLDQGFKNQEHCFFHPLNNDTSIALHASDLDKFLKSIGREPVYVDFLANPSVGKDQPPDLAAFVPSASEKTANTTNSIPVADKPEDAAAKAVKPSKKVQNVQEKVVNDSSPPSGLFANTEKFVEEIVEKTSALLIKEKTHGEQLGTMAEDLIRKHLSSEFKMLAMTLKNTAYAEGFKAGTQHKPKRSKGNLSCHFTKLSCNLVPDIHQLIKKGNGISSYMYDTFS
ncbi:hypothetical protein ACFE04_026005 [Oxalis oulophora]